MFLTDRPEWFNRAHCRGKDPNLFMPREKQGRNDNYERARKMCAACPVKRPCAELGMSTLEYGMWGGLVPRTEDRVARRRARRLAS